MPPTPFPSSILSSRFRPPCQRLQVSRLKGKLCQQALRKLCRSEAFGWKPSIYFSLFLLVLFSGNALSSEKAVWQNSVGIELWKGETSEQLKLWVFKESVTGAFSGSHIDTQTSWGSTYFYKGRGGPRHFWSGNYNFVVPQGPRYAAKFEISIPQSTQKGEKDLVHVKATNTGSWQAGYRIEFFERELSDYIPFTVDKPIASFSTGLLEPYNLNSDSDEYVNSEDNLIDLSAHDATGNHRDIFFRITAINLPAVNTFPLLLNFPESEVAHLAVVTPTSNMGLIASNNLQSGVSVDWNPDNPSQTLGFSQVASGSRMQPQTSINYFENTVAASGGAYSFSVSSNTSWTASETKDWLGVSPTSGSGNGSVAITVQPNPSVHTRRGIVSISGNTHEVIQRGITRKVTPQASDGDYDGQIKVAWPSGGENVEYEVHRHTENNLNSNGRRVLTTTKSLEFVDETALGDTTYYYWVFVVGLGPGDSNSGYWQTPVINSLTVSGPGYMNEGGTATYTCIATYNNGLETDVSSVATWSEDSIYAGMSGNTLTASQVASDQAVTVTANYEGKSDDHVVTISDVPPGAIVDLKDDGTNHHILSSTSVYAGGTVRVQGIVVNEGNIASGDFKVNVYLSSDSAINSTDVLLGTVSMSSISGGGNDKINLINAKVPSSLNAGDYYVGWIIDSGESVSETREDNNMVLFKAGAAKLTVTHSFPNLDYTKYWTNGHFIVSKSEGTSENTQNFTTQDTVYLDWAIYNNSSVNIPTTFYTDLYVDDVLVHTWETTGLSSRFWTFRYDYSLGSFSAGEHILKIKTDSTSVIPETNENDNEFTKAITVTEPKILSSIAIHGSTSVNEGSTSLYTCIATYSDDSTVDVTSSATWSVNSVYATMTGSSLNTSLISSDKFLDLNVSYGGESDNFSVTIKNRPIDKISISGSDSINENDTAAYICTVFYSDGQSEDITESASWSENSGYASITGSTVTAGAVDSTQTVTITASYDGESDTHTVEIKNVPELLYIYLNGPITVDEGSIAEPEYSCTAVFSGGSSVDVTEDVEWTVTGGSAVMIGASLEASLVSADQTVTVSASYLGKTASRDVVIKDVPSSLELVGPFSVNEGFSGDYTCRLKYGFGDYSDVTALARWTLEGEHAQLSAEKRLNTNQVEADEFVTITVEYDGKVASREVRIVNLPIQDGVFTVEVEDGVGTIVNCSSDVEGSLVIPSVINGIPIEAIGANAFISCGGLTSVDIPRNITSVPGSAFGYCIKLSEINVDLENPSYVSADGVLYTKNMQELVRYPAGRTAEVYAIPSGVKTIGEEACTDCKYLKVADIPESVNNIRRASFVSCEVLTTVYIDGGGVSVGVAAFRDSPHLTKFYFGSASPAIVDWGNFANIDSFAAVYCWRQHEQTFDIENGKWNGLFINYRHFEQHDLEWVSTDDGIEITGCSSEVNGNVEIPLQIDGEKVVAIKDLAFYKCDYISEIHIPKYVSAIDPVAFSYCERLSAFGTHADNLDYQAQDGVLFSKGLSTLVRYPEGKNAAVYIVPSQVTTIRKYAFLKCMQLTNVMLPGSVTSIETGAFMDCSSLKEITLPASLATINNRAFMRCKALEKITIPNGVSSIGYSAFRGCEILTEIIFDGAAPLSVEYDAFEGVRLGSKAMVSPDYLSSYGEAGDNWNGLVLTLHGFDANIGFDKAMADANLTGDDAEPDATPFNDGVPNLLKFAFNMNLAGPDAATMEIGGTSGLPTSYSTNNSGGQPVWRVEYVRRKDSGLTYTPQQSTSMNGFSPMTGTPVVTSINDDYERVTIDEPYDPATTPKLFVRVAVTKD
ncbi:MAG: leucine-rich repeat protein [Akkermansiaceae bacterium]|nr:leucine-rich repeat protein [Akkermansiaceae bacterium]